jgi:hypothetical protein
MTKKNMLIKSLPLVIYVGISLFHSLSVLF